MHFPRRTGRILSFESLETRRLLNVGPIAVDDFYQIPEDGVLEITATLPLETREYSFAGNDVIYSSSDALLYVSDGQQQAVVPLDPITGAVRPAILLGSAPGPLAISDDGTMLWVGVASGHLLQIDLETRSIEQQISLDGYLAEDIEMVPGTVDSVIVTLQDPASSPRARGVAVYDHGVRRGAAIEAGNNVEITDDASTVFGFDAETADKRVIRLTLGPQGLTEEDSVTGLVAGEGDMDWSGGRLYFPSGEVLDGATLSPVDTIDAGAVTADASLDRVYVLASAERELQVWDQPTLQKLATISLGNSRGELFAPTRFGTNGLAVLTTQNQLLVVRAHSIDGVVRLGVMSNDSDPDQDSLSASLVTSVSNGRLEFAANGSLTYTPDPNFFGQDQFEYRVSDGNGGTDRAIVQIEVTSQNDDPDARDDYAEIMLGVTNELLDVLANDTTEPDQGETLTLTGASATAHGGRVEIVEENMLTYTPPSGFWGLDSFTYEVSDGMGGTDQATVQIQVIGWHNIHNPTDVTNDGRLTPRDALLIINHLNAKVGNRDLPAPPAVPPPFLDVTNDRVVTPRDALVVINALIAQNKSEGESGLQGATANAIGANAVPAISATRGKANGTSPPLVVSPPPTGSVARQSDGEDSQTAGQHALLWWWTVQRRARDRGPFPGSEMFDDQHSVKQKNPA